MMFQGEFLILDRDAQGAAVMRLEPPGQGKPFARVGLWTEIREALERLTRQGRIPLLLIQGSKRGFLAGWDPFWLETALDEETWSPAHLAQRSALDALAQVPFPTIAAIHGPCLAEGLELALACDYRIALDQPRLQFGFLTEERGLIPEGGRIGKLIGLIGWEKSALLVAGGTWIGGPSAKKWGLLDGLARDESGLRALIVMSMGKALAEGKKKWPRFPLRTWRQTLWESTGVGRMLLARGMKRRLAPRLREGAPATDEALAWLSQLPADPREIESAQTLNRKLRGLPATSRLIAFQAEFLRWQESQTAKPQGAPSALAFWGSGNAGIRLVAMQASKGGKGYLLEKTPELLGRITLGLKKAMMQGSGAKKIDKLATIQADPEGIAARQAAWSLLDGSVPQEAPRPGGELLNLNRSSWGDKTDHGIPVGLVVLPDRPPLALITNDPKSQNRAGGWLAGLGCLVRPVEPSCVWMGPMILWTLWDEIVQQIVAGASPQSLEESWTRFGFRPGPLKMLDLQGLDLANRMESAWSALSPFQVDRSWAAVLTEAGFTGLPGRRGIGMEVLGRWVVNPLAINRLKKHLERTDAPQDPVWRALPTTGKAREGRERALLRLSAVLASFQVVCGWSDANLDHFLVAAIGWPAHQPGPMAWANQRGWEEVRQALDKLAGLTGRAAFQPGEAVLARARQARVGGAGPT